MSEGVFIIGAGGLGREAAWIVQETEGQALCGFFIDDSTEYGEFTWGAPILGPIESFPRHRRWHAYSGVCALGYPHIKRQLVERADKVGLRWTNLKHPSVQMSDDVYWNAGGNILCAGSVLTVNISLGKHVGILGATIGHDSTIGDFSTICPNACVSGHCIIESGVFVGANATILPGICVGAGASVGAGAVVTKNVRPGSIVAGVPAREITKDDD